MKVAIISWEVLVEDSKYIGMGELKGIYKKQSLVCKDDEEVIEREINKLRDAWSLIYDRPFSGTVLKVDVIGE